MSTTNPTNYIAPQMPVPVPTNTSAQPRPGITPTPMSTTANLNEGGFPGGDISGGNINRGTDVNRGGNINNAGNVNYGSMGRSNIVGGNMNGNDMGGNNTSGNNGDGANAPLPNPSSDGIGGNSSGGISGQVTKGGTLPAGTTNAENNSSALRNGALPATTGSAHAPPRQPRVIIKHADMPQDMQRKAINLALTALERYELERDMAHFLKREFDERFQPSWHCIVGRHFGSFVTHDGSGFLYFYIDKTAVLLFRSGS